jgi:hypothetical protein
MVHNGQKGNGRDNGELLRFAIIRESNPTMGRDKDFGEKDKSDLSSWKEA